MNSASRTPRPVHDLWPLRLMKNRAGQALAEVEVSRPSSYEEVSEVLRSGQVVVPFGGLSGVCGAVEVSPGELALDLGGLDRIEIDDVNLICRAQAGVNGWALEQALNDKGLTLGHFPTSLPNATIGGLVSTRSSGQESSRHGSIEDMVLGLTVALPDGTIVEARPPLRSALGPAMHELWIGAEGRLGVVLEAVLKVHRRPAATIGNGYAFPDLESGLEAVRSLMQSGLRPLVLRLYDEEDTAFNQVADGGCALVIAVCGEPEVAAAEAAVVARLCGRAKGLGPGVWDGWLERRFHLSADRLRRYLEPRGSMLDTVELAAPWTNLLALHREVKAAIAVAGIALCHFSHAYEQGCCAYFTFGGSAGDEAEAQLLYKRAWAGALESALRHGATLTHHHGAGQVRADFAARELGGWLGVWERLSAALDPQRHMNPKGVSIRIR